MFAPCSPTEMSATLWASSHATPSLPFPSLSLSLSLSLSGGPLPCCCSKICRRHRRDGGVEGASPHGLARHGRLEGSGTRCVYCPKQWPVYSPMVPPPTPPPPVVWCGCGLLPSPPVVWCGVVVGCFPPPCEVVRFACGLGWFPPFPPCGVVWVGWFPPACLDLLGVFGKPMLMMILMMMMMMTIIMTIISQSSVSLVGRRVSSAHVPADDYGFFDRGATIFVTVVFLVQLQ